MTGAPGNSGLWSLPFLLTFIGGVFADTYEGPRGKLALAAAGRNCARSGSPVPSPTSQPLSSSERSEKPPP